MGLNSYIHFAGQVMHHATGLLLHREEGCPFLCIKFPSLIRQCVNNAGSTEEESPFLIRTRLL